MKVITFLSLLIGVFFSNMSAYAEGRCPAGYYPVDTPGVLGCAPIPGYGGNQQQPTPPPPQWVDHYGAVATDPIKGVLGTSIDRTSRQAAIFDCQSKGGLNCGLETWYKNRCVAMVVDTGGYNVVNQTTLDEAIQEGMKTCKDAGATGCRVYYSACSLPIRIR